MKIVVGSKVVETSAKIRAKKPGPGRNRTITAQAKRNAARARLLKQQKASAKGTKSTPKKKTNLADNPEKLFALYGSYVNKNSFVYPDRHSVEPLTLFSDDLDAIYHDTYNQTEDNDLAPSEVKAALKEAVKLEAKLSKELKLLFKQCEKRTAAIKALIGKL